MLLVAVLGVPYVARLLAPLVPDSVEARLGAVVEPQVVRLRMRPDDGSCRRTNGPP